MTQGSFIVWMNSNPHNGVIVLWFPVFLLPSIGVFVFLSITFIKSVVATSDHKPLKLYWQVLLLIVGVPLNSELFVTRHTVFTVFVMFGNWMSVSGFHPFSGPTASLVQLPLSFA